MLLEFVICRENDHHSLTQAPVGQLEFPSCAFIAISQQRAAEK
jgi:hypothetical protein